MTNSLSRDPDPPPTCLVISFGELGANPVSTTTTRSVPYRPTQNDFVSLVGHVSSRVPFPGQSRSGRVRPSREYRERPARYYTGMSRDPCRTDLDNDSPTDPRGTPNPSRTKGPRTNRVNVCSTSSRVPRIFRGVSQWTGNGDGRRRSVLDSTGHRYPPLPGLPMARVRGGTGAGGGVWCQ